MERDERLLPLPKMHDIQLTHQDVAATYSPFYDDENVGEGRSIREYFLVVYKRLPLILALTILATAATAFYMYRLPSIYQAQTTLIIEPPKPKIQQSSTVNINLGNDINYYNTQLRLLQNPDLMKKVVLRLGLYKDPNLFSQQNKGLVASLRSMLTGDKSAQNKESLPVLTETSTDEAANNFDTLTDEEKRRVEIYAGILGGGLNVEQTTATNLFNVRVQSDNPEIVARVADAVALIFIEEDRRRAMQGQEDTFADLTKSINQLEADIAQKERERLIQMQNSGLPLAEQGGELAKQRLTQMSTQWLNAEDERRKAQAIYEAAVQASQKGELPAVLPEDKYLQDIQSQEMKLRAELESRVQRIQEKIEEAEEKRRQLLVRYTEEWHEVKALDALIAQLKQTKEKVQAEGTKRIEEESAKTKKKAENQVLTVYRAKLDSALKSEAEARSLYLSEIGIANRNGQEATKLTTLTNDIETSRAMLKTYTQRQKEMELMMNSSRPDNISISSAAQRPGGPIGPNRNRNIIVAFLISLATGIGLAFLFDYLDDSIKSSDDVGRHLGLPTLALIPHHSAVKKQKRSTALATRNGSLTSTALISLEDNRSAIAEAYRHLRTSLLFSSAGKPPQTILVTSSQPSEGKTTTAINTAITLAQSGADVVIIDCDLRRPRLHSHFDLENTTGLTNYLSGDRNPENLLKPYPGLPNLKVVTSGPIPPNPAELLSSNEMKNLLQFLKGNFKHVIVDSPPAISFTDAAILSTLVDGVVLVAMSGKSSIHLMRRFKQRLSTIGARIYGVVLNGIKPNTLEYGYYGYGYTYSYYDSPDDDETTPRMEEDTEVETTKN
jgi:polysaccharide biosynthesis transport protein